MATRVAIRAIRTFLCYVGGRYIGFSLVRRAMFVRLILIVGFTLFYCLIMAGKVVDNRR